ncbi:L,D-transpeptidase family protein [Lujinxingia vulgaris]|uniref:L,D-transpeptidase family protein n=1 Tax=Lujinxingia vulgaris TaxID=2600176 RepID=A0A5C6XED7_9DELT|nr:L,D-transpeptidase family protein [Lujinxingia vulgaris]TXD36484.1 L,D-transpeptidase family protein [Lujinxingia vulgaris]
MKRAQIKGKWRLWALAGACALVFAACGDDGQVNDVPVPVESARMLVEERVGDLGPVLEQAAREQALRQAVEELVAHESARPFAARVVSGLRYATVFQREYIDGELWPFLSDEDGLSEVGEAVLAQVQRAELHAMDDSEFGLARIEALLARHGKAAAPAAEASDEAKTFSLRPAEVEALVAAVDELGEEQGDLEGPIVERALIRGGSGLARVQEFVNARAEAIAQPAALRAELELYVADAALRYAREMRHANLNRLDWRDLRDAGGSTELILGRMQRTLQALYQAGDAAEVASVFEGLEPDHPQYRALFEATERYRQIVEEGGWKRVRKVPLEEGYRSVWVEVLRERLKREGYPQPSPAEAAAEVAQAAEEVEAIEEVVLASVSDAIAVAAEGSGAETLDEVDPKVMDAELIEAMRHYRQTHQFRTEGEPTPGVWRSLNVSAEDRLAQMELTLKRWRETHLDGDEDFIFVNIPDFHAEVYVGGERKMRFRVVVGNNKRVCDRETGRWVYPNATPVQWAPMEHMILNPSWYVPPRLVRESLEPKVQENPDYYEEEGYEVLQLGSGEAVRQKPGPNNALGVAKFIFPNEHNTYLHDTPQKHYFEYPVRGYSSGCVRVQEPVELARFLANYDGRDVDVNETIASGRTRKIEFENQLPVITEYYTVWIDDEGYANFLADIYRDDARRSSEDPEAFDDCSSRFAPKEVELEGSEEQPEGVGSDFGP